MMESKQDLLAAALSYARPAWAVLPVQPKGKAPLGTLVPHGLLNATTNPDILQQWWAAEPQANIGIRTGAISGLLVLDIDPRNGGDQSLAGWEEQHGTLPETVEAFTGGGGRHLIFAHPGGSLPSRVFRPGVDVKSDGGYIVVPPSLHPSGHLYAWKPDAGPHATALAPFPQRLLESLKHQTTASPSARAVSEWRHIAMHGVEAGQRNTCVAQLVGHLLRLGIDPIVALYLIAAWNQVHNRPPLPQDEVIRTVNAIAGRELRRRQGGPHHG